MFTHEPIAIMDLNMLTGAQIRAARSLLHWSAETLAERAGVGIATIRRAESTDDVPSVNAQNLAKILAAIKAAGVATIDSGAESLSGGPGVRMTR